MITDKSTTKPLHAHGLTAAERDIGTLIARAIKLEATARDKAIGAAIVAAEARIIAALQPPAPPPIVVPPPFTTEAYVTSVEALLDALHDDSLDVITIADGTYRVAAAGLQKPTSLWIGSAYAGRTRPILVRAATPGGVTFDGQGADHFGWISFEGGAHDQTWEGFTPANGTATQTGVVTFGGANGAVDQPAAHHITMRGITLPASLRGTTGGSGATDHGVYVSQAAGGVHDIVLEDFDVDGSPADGLHSALHFNHESAAMPNGRLITAYNWRVKGTNQALILWKVLLADILVEHVRIADARSTAVRYEALAGSSVTLRDVISTGSPDGGLVSTTGRQGLVLDACDLR